jgi:hypothetical protein
MSRSSANLFRFRNKVECDSGLRRRPCSVRPTEFGGLSFFKKDAVLDHGEESWNRNPNEKESFALHPGQV